MKLFVTGLSGFIAKHLCKRLVDDGHEVHAVATQLEKVDMYGWMRNKNFKVVDSFMLRVYKYDLVIHLAATTSITNEFNAGIWQNNAVFAEMVMNTPFRTIYASSTSVYELNNCYAHSKAYLEHLGVRHGDALCLRLFNVYGPGNNKGIVKRSIDCCMSGETLILSGGDQVRDFIYVDDVVDIIMQNLYNPHPVMDVGTGIGTPVQEVVKIVSEQMQRFGYLPLSVAKKPSDYAGEQIISVAKPTDRKYTSLQEGIAKTIQQTIK